MPDQADLETVAHVQVATEGYLVGAVQRGRPEVLVDVRVVESRKDEILVAAGSLSPWHPDYEPPPVFWKLDKE